MSETRQKKSTILRNFKILKSFANDNITSENGSITKSEPNSIKPRADRSNQDKRTVFVGNLPTSITNKALLKIFRNIAPVESSRLRAVATAQSKTPAHILLKNNLSQRVSAYGYVVFSEESSTRLAVKELNNTLIDGRHITVDLCSSANDFKTTIFVTNINKNVDEEILREFFCDCGDITKIRIVCDRVNGESKGFGFITFKDTAGMLLAVRKNSEILKNKKIIIRKANKHKNSKGENLNIKKSKIKNNPKGENSNEKKKKRKIIPKHLKNPFLPKRPKKPKRSQQSETLKKPKKLKKQKRNQ